MSNREKAKCLNAALKAMADFRRAFGRPLDGSMIAEIYVAYALCLCFTGQRNEHGYDLVDADKRRYQVKHRDKLTGNVDLNNFSFDFLILVHLDEDYRPQGLWRLPVEKAKEIFVARPRFRRFQATQKKVRSHATALEVRDWLVIVPPS